MFANTKESGLEMLIVKWLVEHNGYEEGSNTDYNKEYAIDETRLFRFLQDTQPEQLEKLGIRKSHQKYAQFLNRLQGEISKRGIVDVLRNGIKVYHCQESGYDGRSFSRTSHCQRKNRRASSCYGRDLQHPPLYRVLLRHQ